MFLEESNDTVECSGDRRILQSLAFSIEPVPSVSQRNEFIFDMVSFQLFGHQD